MRCNRSKGDAMKIQLAILAMAAVLLTGMAPALAAQRSVTLGVDLWCSSCAFIVKRTLERVEGVRDVAVSTKRETATVTYDDGRTNVAILTRAMAAVGMRAEVVAE